MAAPHVHPPSEVAHVHRGEPAPEEMTSPAEQERERRPEIEPERELERQPRADQAASPPPSAPETTAVEDEPDPAQSVESQELPSLALSAPDVRARGQRMADPRRWHDLVDLHSHVLPAVDDGAASQAEALGMLRIAQEDGIVIMAATPHADRCRPEQMRSGVARLNQLARAEGLTITVVPGSEVRLEADLAKLHQNGRIATLGDSPYLLLELALFGDWPPYLLEAIYELQVAGLWPILAHAERYPAVQNDPGIVIDLIVRGVMIQINADSLLSRAAGRGRGARRTAETLLRHHLAHLVASDAHGTDARAPRLSAAYDRVAELVGEDYALDMIDASRDVLRGVSITLPDPQTPERRRLLSRRRG